MSEIASNTMLNSLIANIEETVMKAKEKLAGALNSTMTETYWLIGKYIVESEQNGNIKATYGKDRYTEGDLEQRIIDNLQSFLLELGKGFSFVGRQYKITVNNAQYNVDLVFYHRILKCFVLIDMKRNSVKHEDIGQMNMYLGYLL